MKNNNLIYKQKFQTDLKVGWEDALVNSNKNLDELHSLDKQAQEQNSIVGRFFSLPVADGRVFYQVTALKRNKCTVTICEGICLDGYSDNILGEESELPLKKTEELIQRDKILKQLFH